MTEDAQWGFHTRGVKSYPSTSGNSQPLTTPIIQATNFQFPTSEALGAAFKERSEHVYTRFGHPTTGAAARTVATLEGAEGALIFSSGMAAITTSLLAVLRPGDHVVAQGEIFSPTFGFLDGIARSFGIHTDFVDPDPEIISMAVRPETALIYVETPSNPVLRLADIAAISVIAREGGIPLFVDNTFASSYLQRPLELGATLSLQSGTKFLGGHSDVMCGIAAGDRLLIRKIYDTQLFLGGVLDPHAAWLLLRGVKTLGLRVQRQCDSALQLAQFLEAHARVERVSYPWLESFPQHDLARRQMRAGGGVISFEVVGGLAGARTLLAALRLIPIATRLGGVESVVEIPYELDFSDDEPGATTNPGLVRLAVGIEDVIDLKDDLAQALDAVSENQVGVALQMTQARAHGKAQE